MKYFNNYLKSIIRTGQDLKSLGPVQLTLASVNAWSYASELDGSEFEADGTWNIMLQAMHWPIDHFTVSCLVAWPLNESEAGGDLVLIETSLLFSY